MLRMIAKLLRALNSEASPVQISAGFVAGMIFGLTPLMSLHNLFLLFLVLILRVNLSACILSWTAFSGIAYVFDPLMEMIGETLLTAGVLKPMWGALYSSDFWRLTHFNNTLVLGSFVAALVLALPLYFISTFIIVKYRAHLLAWVRKSRLMQLFKANKLYKAYSALSSGGVS